MRSLVMDIAAVACTRLTRALSIPLPAAYWSPDAVINWDGKYGPGSETTHIIRPERRRRKYCAHMGAGHDVDTHIGEARPTLAILE